MAFICIDFSICINMFLEWTHTSVTHILMFRMIEQVSCSRLSEKPIPYVFHLFFFLHSCLSILGPSLKIKQDFTCQNVECKEKCQGSFKEDLWLKPITSLFFQVKSSLSLLILSSLPTKLRGPVCFCSSLYGCSVMSDSLWPCGLEPTREFSVEFYRKNYWSSLPFPPPGDLPDTGIEPESLASPALAGIFVTTVPFLSLWLLPPEPTPGCRARWGILCDRWQPLSHLPMLPVHWETDSAKG